MSAQWPSSSAGDGSLARLLDVARATDPVWDRWTIDEIDEGTARVLIARARSPQEVRAIADRLWGELEGGPPRHVSSSLRRLVALIEVRPPFEQWGPEEIQFFGVGDLAPKLTARGGKPGLPGNRPLREGDVFWVFAADEGIARLLRLPTEERAVASPQRLGAFDIWDVTAAARQIAKRSYHHALRMAGEPVGGEARRG